MGYNAYTRVDINLRPGTTRQQVEEACQPFLDDRCAIELMPDDEQLFETGVAFHEASANFVLQITSSVGYSFGADVFAPMMKAIGSLALKPFEAVLRNESSASDDDRDFRVIAGPADMLPDFTSRLAAAQIREHLHSIRLPSGSTGLGLEAAKAEAALHVELADASGASRPRLFVDLSGCALTEAELADALALTILLSRVIGRDVPVHIHNGADLPLHASVLKPEGWPTQGEWEEICEAFGLDGSFQYAEADVLEIARQYRDLPADNTNAEQTPASCRP
ncbi:MAG: hypothetical protein WA159_01370 [Variovorax sp.]